jgi:DNA primase
MDQQKRDSKFALLSEGPLDAIALGGLAVLTNEVSERKAEIIDTLGKEIIVVPDRDKAGKHLINAALKYGWSVAFPDWQDDIKDIADACLRYGRLYTLRSILATKQSNKLKIELYKKRIGFK